MATTTSTAAGGLTLPLTRIHVPENVRALNAEHVDRSRRRAAWVGRPVVSCSVGDRRGA